MPTATALSTCIKLLSKWREGWACPSPSMSLRSRASSLPGWRCQVSVIYVVETGLDEDDGKGCILASISRADTPPPPRVPCLVVPCGVLMR